jgi:hypothetical protein
MGKLYFFAAGIIIGIINGLFGSGGGIIAVPMLKKSGMSIKESHATSIALTLPLSIVSCFFYMKNSDFSNINLIYVVLAGVAGAAVGGVLMKKMPGTYLKKAFGIILIISGIRMLSS